MTDLDASAVLALIQDEPGADLVAAELAGATLSTANLAEVVGKLVDVGVDAARARALLITAGLTIEPLTEQDAQLAGAIRALPGGPHALPRGPLLPGTDRPQRPSRGGDRRPHLGRLDLPIRVRLLR